MPRPRPRAAFPTAAAAAAQGLSVDQVDPDHLTFLRHLRPDGNSYAVDLPARGDSPPVTVRYESATPAANGEAGSPRVVEEREIPPAGGLPWYETAKDMDEDYRNFWRQTRVVDGRPVLRVGEDVLRYELDAGPVRLSDIADWAEKKGWKEVAAVPTFSEDGDGVGVGEKEKVASIGTDGRRSPPSLPRDMALESRVRDSPSRRQKRKVEQGQEEKGEGKCGAEKINVVNREEEMLNEMPVETLNTVNTQTPRHDADEGHIASGCYGVVWPTHIMERPESPFKEKLLRDLRKPCSLEEYKKLLNAATDRLPATKSRQTRRGVTYYNSAHETNQSYFDTHPDLEEQVRNTSYPNQLALLRGFFFWLKNVTNDDQFRPWSDDFKQYSIIPFE